MLLAIPRFLLKHNIRGQTRLTFFLAEHFKALQSVPVHFLDRPPVYVDLRGGRAHEWLKGSPWTSSPDEPAEQESVKGLIKPGDVVLDIGANLGLYTTLFSRLVGPSGQVHSFEPNTQLLPLLKDTVRSLNNVTLYPFGLSDCAGESVLYVPNDHTFGSLANYTKDLDHKEQIGLSDAEEINCKLTTLDALSPSVIPYPNLIKCDVEGAELLVFKGARNMLNRRDAPVILFEALEQCNVAFGYSRLGVVDFLRSLSEPGYQFSDLDQKNILAIPLTRR